MNGDRDMKILMFTAVSLMLIAGCDDQKSAKRDDNHISEVKREQARFDCKSGSVSVDCEVTGGDQLGSGKWRHAKISLAGSDVSLIVDGESFYKQSLDSAFYQGTKYFTFYLKGINNSKAKIVVTNSNSGAAISLNVWNSKGQLVLTSSQRP